MRQGPVLVTGASVLLSLLAMVVSMVMAPRVPASVAYEPVRADEPHRPAGGPTRPTGTTPTGAVAASAPVRVDAGPESDWRRWPPPMPALSAAERDRLFGRPAPTSQQANERIAAWIGECFGHLIGFRFELSPMRSMTGADGSWPAGNVVLDPNDPVRPGDRPVTGPPYRFSATPTFGGIVAACPALEADQPVEFLCWRVRAEQVARLAEWSRRTIADDEDTAADCTMQALTMALAVESGEASPAHLSCAAWIWQADRSQVIDPTRGRNWHERLDGDSLCGFWMDYRPLSIRVCASSRALARAAAHELAGCAWWRATWAVGWSTSPTAKWHMPLLVTDGLRFRWRGFEYSVEDVGPARGLTLCARRLD